MNKSRFPFLSACWFALALVVWPMVHAQEAPPPPVDPVPPPAAVEKPTDVAPTADEEALPAARDPAVPAQPATGGDNPATETPEAAPTPESKPAGELRELGAEPEQPAGAHRKKSSRPRVRTHQEAPRIGNQTLAAGATRSEMVTIAGDTLVDGHVTDAAVSVFGSTTVNGTVDDAAVSVFGSTTINGTVKGETVTVFGDLILGPDAEVGGEAVVVFGKIIAAPGAKIHGGTQEIGSFGAIGDLSGLRVWFTKCLMMMRPLAFDSRLLWAWYVGFGFLAFYALIALLAPAGVRKCVTTLEERPGYSLLSALLVMVLTPIAFLLLVLTVFIAVGAVLIPAFALGLFMASIFGKIVILAWIGRQITRLAGDGPLAHPVFGVLIGGVIMLLLYTIPIAGFVIYKLAGILGLGVVVYTLLLQFKASRPPKPVVVAPVTTGVAGAPVPLAPPGSLPPVISAATLPRVGFWHRLAASVVDAILVGMVCGFLSNIWHGFEVFPFWFALYCVIMWGTKGTTIGGIICSLKVVRIDDRPIDWSVTIVRGLAGFLSLFIAGLGFIWVAFDDEKQSWHDKIAGTTIVRVPKGTSLL